MELSPEQRKELEVVERFHIELKKIDKEVRKIIVGQKEVVDQVMMSLLTGGNSIITGVPGIGKTTLAGLKPGVTCLNQHQRHKATQLRVNWRGSEQKYFSCFVEGR